MNNYQETFFTTFKNEVKKDINKNFFNTFENTIKKCQILLDIESTSNLNLNTCKKWFQEIVHSEFILNIIKKFSPFNEIIFHDSQIIENNNKIINTDFNWENDDFFLTLQTLALKENKQWNHLNPFVSFHYENYRITLIHPNISPYKKIKAFIRGKKKPSFSTEDFSTKNMEVFFKEIIQSKKNILISGSTSSGKTTFLNSLLNTHSNLNEHTIVIEDTHEIKLKSKNVTYMTSSHPEDLMNYCSIAMRISPKRIILGEMRSKEVIPFTLLSNCGHKGLLSTIHANSAIDSISRVSLLFSLYSNTHINPQNILELICKNIDYIIHIENKKINEIIKIIGVDSSGPIYEKINF